MGPHRFVVKEALEYVRDIEANIPKHFWPTLIKDGWMVLEDDGTPNWNYAVTAYVSKLELIQLVKKCKAWYYFYDVAIHKPFVPSLKNQP